MDLTSVSGIGEATTLLVENTWLWAGNFIVLIVLTIAFMVFSARSGRSGLVSLIVALYISYAIYIVFPYTDVLVSAGGTAVIKAVISVILFAAMTILPYLLIERLIGGGFGTFSILYSFTLSFCAAAFMIALGYHVFDISNIYKFPAPLDQLFAPQGYFFWWFIAPIAGVYFLAR